MVQVQGTKGVLEYKGGSTMELFCMGMLSKLLFSNHPSSQTWLLLQNYPQLNLKHIIFYAEATVGLDNMTYTVKEDSLQLNICVVVFSPTTACPIAFPFELIFAANAGTACTLKLKCAKHPYISSSFCPFSKSKDVIIHSMPELWILVHAVRRNVWQ